MPENNSTLSKIENRIEKLEDNFYKFVTEIKVAQAIANVKIAGFIFVSGLIASGITTLLFAFFRKP